MQAWQEVVEVEGEGAEAQLVVRRAPVLEPGPGEVLIEVYAAGVNRADVKQRQGRYLMPEGAPSVPGLEAAGKVAAVGPGVSRWRAGDGVCALLLGGGYAEYCVAPAAQCLPVPGGRGFVEAAALPEVAFTSWLALMTQSRLLPGETVLIHGAAGGLGGFALQLAAAFGCPVLATAGSDDKRRQCAELGAAVSLNYRHEDVATAVADFTRGRGVDVIINQVGAPYLARDLAMLTEGGRVCIVSADCGRQADLDVFAVMAKGLSITGLRLRPRSLAEKARIADELERRVWPLLGCGRILPRVTRTFPLSQAGDAHALMESGEASGKLVLVVR